MSSLRGSCVEHSRHQQLPAHSVHCSTRSALSFLVGMSWEYCCWFRGKQRSKGLFRGKKKMCSGSCEMLWLFLKLVFLYPSLDRFDHEGRSDWDPSLPYNYPQCGSARHQWGTWTDGQRRKQVCQNSFILFYSILFYHYASVCIFFLFSLIIWMGLNKHR